MIVIAIVIGVFAAGFFIATRCYKHPMAILFGGLAFGAGLCTLAMGILYVGCMLILGK